MTVTTTTMMNRITHPKDRILRCLDHGGEDRADAGRGWVGIEMRSHGWWGRMRGEVAGKSGEAAVGRRRRRRRWRRILKGRVHHDGVIVVIRRWRCYFFSGRSNLCALGLGFDYDWRRVVSQVRHPRFCSLAYAAARLRGIVDASHSDLMQTLIDDRKGKNNLYFFFEKKSHDWSVDFYLFCYRLFLLWKE